MPQRVVVLFFAASIAALVLLTAFGAERSGGLDELALFNPSYMLARHGRLTYPVFFDYFDQPVLIHPPLHVGLIGLLMRAGVRWYYAEALPAVILFLLAIVAVVRARFPAAVQLGLLYSIGFVLQLPSVSLFGTRPEGAVHAAWLLGAVLLESARQKKWDPPLLAAGAFVFTWGCATHYYATPGLLGMLVYAVWVVRDLGWRGARRPLASIAAGGCLFGVPYLAFYIVPYWRDIVAAIRSAEGGVGFSEAVRLHGALYRQWSQRADVPRLLALALRPGVPLLFVAVPLLALIRPLRGMALAAIPLLAFLTYGAAHKQYSYLIHEWGLLAAAVAAGAVLLLESRLHRGLALPAALVLAILLLASGWAWISASVSLRPRTHEGEIARAACRDILGAHARVTARIGAWYTSGADALLSFDSLSVRADPWSTVTRVDAVADYPHMSDYVPQGRTANLAAWYSEGRLTLRGFYFGSSDAEMKLVLLTPHTPPKVRGYVRDSGRMRRFDEDAAGDFEVYSAECPETPDLSLDAWASWPMASVLRLPKPVASPQRIMLTALAPRSKGGAPSGCRVLRAVPGVLRDADAAALLAALRRDDPPIHICRLEDDPGCALPAVLFPPAGATPVAGVLRLDQLQTASQGATIERGTPIRVTTPVERAIFAASIPVTGAGLGDRTGWVSFRLRVTQGSIGFAVLRNGRIEGHAPAAVGTSADAQDLAFPVIALGPGHQVVLYNASAEGAAVVELYEAGVLVK